MRCLALLQEAYRRVRRPAANREEARPAEQPWAAPRQGPLRAVQQERPLQGVQRQGEQHQVLLLAEQRPALELQLAGVPPVARQLEPFPEQQAEHPVPEREPVLHHSRWSNEWRSSNNRFRPLPVKSLLSNRCSK